MSSSDPSFIYTRGNLCVTSNGTGTKLIASWGYLNRHIPVVIVVALGRVTLGERYRHVAVRPDKARTDGLPP